MNTKLYFNRFLALLVTYILFSEIIGFSQQHKIWFKHLTTKEGLSQNTVDCILRDNQGFIWFGTWNGLNKYDGYDFILYQNDPSDSNTISNNFIYSLCEDDYNRIWIGTGGGGINVFNKEKEIFYHINHDSLKINSISNDVINALFKDNEGDIWVGTDNGLDRIKLKNQYLTDIEVSSFTNEQQNVNSLSNNQVFTVIQDHLKFIWIGTNEGLNKFDASTNTFQQYYNIPGNEGSIAFNTINTVYEDDQNNLWIGTFYGLSKINLNSNNISNYYNSSSDPNSIAHNTITSICQDSKGTIWIGNLGSLSQYNSISDNFTNYQNDFSDDKSISNNYINSLYADDYGNVWIGTDKGGVNVIDRNRKPFKHWEYKSTDDNSLSGNIVNSIYEDKFGNLWIGTSGGGLNVYNKNTNQFKHFKYSPNNAVGLNSNFISAIIQDQFGTLWIGTWGDGINRLNKYNNKKENQFIHYQDDPNSNSGSTINFVSSFLIDKFNRLWVGTASGLFIYNKQKDSYIQFTNHYTQLSSIVDVGCLEADSSGNIWVGTLHGLYRILIDPKISKQISLNDNNIKLFIYNPKDTNSISAERIITIYRDNSGTMWFGTYGKGFDKLIYISDNNTGKITEKFINYTEKEGLSDNVVYGILEDDFHNLWLSTNHGLSRFHKEKEEFKNYYEEDGIIGNQFFWSASCKNNTGELFFGTTKGMISFDPDQIGENSYVPSVTITDFKIFNKSIKPGILYKNKFILPKAISYINDIKLSYRENNISFEFSALFYSSPEKIKYAYKLEGFEDNWVYVNSKRRFANYTNLNGGTYNFLVKATNNDGIWNETPTNIRIIITPPFYKTLWFKTLLFITLIAIVFLIINIRFRSLKTQKQKLEKQVKERTAIIESQKENLKKAFQLLEQRKLEISDQKEALVKNNREILKQRDQLIKLNEQVHIADQAKLRFFTNISHEFRTPLTLIIGPIEKMIQSFINNEDLKSQATLIKRNAQRLLSLINQLMDFRKIETSNFSLKVSKKNIVPFIQDIYHSFSQFASDHNITYNFNTNEESILIWFDENVIERIIFNILTNAFKYTPNKGNISVSLTNNSEIGINKSFPDGYLAISIKDSGIGIPKNQLNQIFDRFYQVNSTDITLNKVENSGTGIGLALSKNLVELHKGEIVVNSEMGIGTEFIIYLPLTSKKYAKEQIIDYVEKQPDHKKLLDEISVLENRDENISNLYSQSLQKNKKSLLIVEDNLDLRTFIANNLSADYNIFEASDGQKAIELAKKYDIDLMISDIMMPNIDGIELCNIFKTNINYSHIPIILLTAKNSIESKIEGYKTGADDFIEKPFNMELLHTRIINLIESRIKLKQLFSTELTIDPAKTTTTTLDEEFLKKAIDVVESNFSDSKFGVEEFVEKMFVSRSLLHKKLTAITDQSASTFITSIRLKKSVSLLKTKKDNISQIAYEVGFNDPKYFSRIFKKNYGLTPTDYQKKELQT